MPGRQHPEVAPLNRQAIVLLLLACALVPATAAGIPALAQTSQAAPETTTTTTTGGIGPAVFPQAEAASARTQRAYRRWRRKLNRHDLRLGHDLVVAARSEQRSPTAVELRRSIRTMKTRFRRFLRSEEGRATAYRFKIEKIPAWGRQQLASIAACESHGNPRAVGGGGAYRGMYQFSFSTWQVVGGSGDPAAAPRHEQTWRAWLLLRRHGAGHWPVCG
jgi:Transglycosylase-like domain